MARAWRTQGSIWLSFQIGLARKTEGNTQISGEILQSAPELARETQPVSEESLESSWEPCGRIGWRLGSESQRLNVNCQAQWQVHLPGETAHLHFSVVGVQ